jgi:hypothetical protein
VTARSSLSFAPASRVWRAVALVLTIVGALAVASTHFTFSNTADEPGHIAAGVQWLAGHRAYDETHPPLARIAAGAGPYFRGERVPPGSASPREDGARLLGKGSHYRTTLALARLGELPFFVLLCGVVWAWGRFLTDERGGAVAVLLAASDPNLLAHAGLATPEIALAATVTGALFAFVVWLEHRHWTGSLALGAALGLAATVDYSALAMLAVALPAIYAVHRWRTHPARQRVRSTRWRMAGHLCLTATSAAIAGWAIYGFQVGPLVEGSWLVVPAPEWFRGFIHFIGDGSASHTAFLFGERSPSGWWYYYAVALLVKTPLPLLLLTILGAAVAVRGVRGQDASAAAPPVAAALAIIVAVAIIGDDSGIRLVLPVFGLFAVLGSVAVVELWDAGAKLAPAKRLVRATVAATLCGAVIVPMRAHPDHLAYFNPIAGDRPELILVDSNLDWGQDLYRLGTTMKRMHIDSVAVAYYGSANFDAAGVRNARALTAAERPTGWIAASQTMLAGVGGDGAFEWLNDLQPVGRVGSSLVLFYVPPHPKWH